MKDAGTAEKTILKGESGRSIFDQFPKITLGGIFWTTLIGAVFGAFFFGELLK